jgi:hypothetical protein
VIDATAKGQLQTMLFLPVAMVAGLVVGLAVGPHRVWSLTLIVASLVVGTWAPAIG